MFTVIDKMFYKKVKRIPFTKNEKSFFEKDIKYMINDFKSKRFK